MVRAVCNFNIEKISKMSKTFMKKALVTAIFLSLIFIVLGAVTIYYALTISEPNYISVALGGLVCLGSFYPIFSTFRAQKKNHKETVKAMQLDKGDLTIDITVREKKMEVVTTQFNEVQNETILIRNLSKVKLNKNGVAIYLGGDMYYVFNEEIVVGTREELVRIFERANVKVTR